MSSLLLACMQLFTVTRLNPNPERSMSAIMKRKPQPETLEMKRKRKPKPVPLERSRYLIDVERGNVDRRTRERCALLSRESETEEDYSVDKATQTEIPLREVLVELHDWHTCLNAFCFCLLLLCINLLYFQWLYTAKKLTRV